MNMFYLVFELQLNSPLVKAISGILRIVGSLDSFSSNFGWVFGICGHSG